MAPVLAEAVDYHTYRELIENLLAENKTTGPNQSEAMVQYTQMNHQRMARWDKRTQLSEETLGVLEAITHPQLWVIITEGWCGDAAHSVPVIAKMAESNPNIDLRLVLRDENPDFMDRHLTNGGKSIPKLVVLDGESHEQLWEWGPRPAPAQAMVMEYKALPDPPPYSEFVKNVQLWYSRDKTVRIQQEVAEGLRAITVPEVS